MSFWKAEIHLIYHNVPFIMEEEFFNTQHVSDIVLGV